MTDWNDGMVETICVNRELIRMCRNQELALRSLVPVGLAASFLTIFLLLASVGVINALPRSVEGEAVLAPWPACLICSLFVSIFLPWVGSLVCLCNPRYRLYFVAFLLASNVVSYLFFGSLLIKAHERGL